MSNDNSWDLASEFPHLKERIHQLKGTSRHFERLFEEYGVITKQILRAEDRIDLISEVEEEQLRKKRLALKDELYTMLTA